MDRRAALVALWALFAAASVGVGFGAAGLVGDPFSDGTTGTSGTPGAAGVAVPSATSTAGGGDPSASRAPSSQGPPTTRPPSRSSEPVTTPAPATTSAQPSRTPGPATTRAPTPRPTAARAVTRSISTRGGLVSATCRSGLVEVSASPAVGWEIEDIDAGPQRDARVRFEQSEDGDGRVEVDAACVRGSPRFALDDDSDDDGGGDGDGDED